MTSLAVNLAGVELRNPIIAASGTCGYIDELADAMDLSRIGAVTTKSITREPRNGNPTWRILDTPCGMLNAIGLANVGLDAFMSDKLPRAGETDCVVIGSVAGGSIEEYVAVAGAFDGSDRLPIIELNVSCPNTDDGLVFGESPARLAELVRAVRAVTPASKLFVKLSPNVGDIASLARAAVEGGADGLTIMNTVHGMAIDVESRTPRLSTWTGGYSGPGVHPIAVRMVHEVYTKVAREAGVPIIGLGGVSNWRDAAELVLAGATAVGVGSILYADPRAPIRIARGLEKWVKRQGCGSIAELLGEIETP